MVLNQEVRRDSREWVRKAVGGGLHYRPQLVELSPTSAQCFACRPLACVISSSDRFVTLSAPLCDPPCSFSGTHIQLPMYDSISLPVEISLPVSYVSSDKSDQDTDVRSE